MRRRAAADSSDGSWGDDDVSSSSSDELSAFSGWGTSDLDSVFLQRKSDQWKPATSSTSNRTLQRPKKARKEPEHLPHLQLTKAQSTSSLAMPTPSPARRIVQEQFALKPPAPVVIPSAASSSNSIDTGEPCKSFAVSGWAVPTPALILSRHQHHLKTTSAAVVARRLRAANAAAKPPPALCKIVGLIEDAEERRSPVLQTSSSRRRGVRATNSRQQRRMPPRAKHDDAMRLVLPSLFGSSHSLESLLSALTLNSLSEQQQQQFDQQQQHRVR